jgi:hypothetical protein
MNSDKGGDATTAMTRGWLRSLASALCALALAQLPACSSPAGPPSPTCTRETIFSSNPQVPASTQVVQTITTPRTGRLTVTVDWVSPESIIRVVLAQSPCGADAFRVKSCNIIVDEFPPPKPVETSTTWLAPGNYDLLLANFTSVGETASVKVNLSSVGCATP